MMRYATSILIALLSFRTDAHSEGHLRKIELDQETKSDVSLQDTKPSLGGAKNMKFDVDPIKGEELSQVSLNKNAKDVWGVNSYGDIYQRNGENGSWKSVSGSLKQISVSGNSNHIYGANSDREAYYRNGNNGGWERIGKDIIMVSVNHCGNSVWAVNKYREVLWREGTKRNSEWKTINDMEMIFVEVSGDGRLILGIDKRGDMYFRKGPGPKDGSWKKINAKGGSFINVSTDEYGDNIWAVDESKRLVYLKGKDASSWEKKGEQIREVSVSNDGKHLWMVDTDNDVWASTDHPVNAVHFDNNEEGCAQYETTSIDTTVDEEKTELE